ncbi:MAG: VWA domain-containing protein [Streptosporangiaceae bacterium]
MRRMLAALVDELRAVGIPVSAGEQLDAATAVARIPLGSREVLRAALQCALVKHGRHLGTFNVIFDLCTADTPRTDRAPLASLPADQLRATLRDSIRSGDTFLQPLLAEEYVRRYAAVEPGRAVAGVRYLIAAVAAADLHRVQAELLGEPVAAGNGRPAATAASALHDRLWQAAVERGVEDFREMLQSAVRRALVADRGARAVRETIGVQVAEDIEIYSASADQMRQIAATVAPLAQHLSRILARQAAAARRKLSIRGTLHRAMGTGGVPFWLVTQPPRPPRPEIVVLCDMSGSVAAFSRFTLDLLAALDSRLNRLRIFAFVDGLAEISALVREARAAGRTLGTLEAAADSTGPSGHSDYGQVMREFAAAHAGSLSRRSVVLVIGDARTNRLDPAIHEFAEIQRRAGQVYWLNPEPRRYWDDGDSVIGRYAPWCTRVEECRTLRQIAGFVLSLAADGAKGGSPCP